VHRITSLGCGKPGGSRGILVNIPQLVFAWDPMRLRRRTTLLTHVSSTGAIFSVSPTSLWHHIAGAEWSNSINAGSGGSARSDANHESVEGSKHLLSRGVWAKYGEVYGAID
jgi:hypothetical protein